MSIEQKVKLTADTTGLKEIEAANRRAFNPATVREYKREAKSLEREHEHLNRRLVELTRSIRGFEKGTEAFKNMRKELRGVQQDARLVATALQAVQRAAAPKPGSGSFVAGLGQGSGLGQYIPTGPGQMSRMAGMGIGGMARRGVRGISSPFMNPGMGGMVGMLNALPGGGVAGGALQAASGYYQEAVQYQRQRLENLPYVSDLEGRTDRMSRVSGRKSETAIAAQQQADEARKNLGSAQKKFLAPVIGAGMVGGRAAMEQQVQQGFVGGMARHAEELLFGGIPKKIRDAAQRKILGQLTFGASGGKTAAEIVGGSIGAGYEMQSAGVGAAGKMSAAEAAAAADRRRIAKARRQAFGDSGIPGLGGLGTTLGFMAGEVQQMTGGFMGARGGVLSKGGTAKDELKEAMIARRRFGIGAEVSGGYQRMFRGGGGGTGEQSLSRTLGGAVAMGLKGVRVNEYLQSLVEMSRKAEQTGIKINVQEFERGAMSLQAMGAEKGQAGRIAGSIQGAAQRVSAGGVQNPMDLLMMRAEGWDPSQGTESYFATKNKMAGGMSSKGMQRLVGMISQGAGGGGGPEQQASMMRSAFGKMGVSIDPATAKRWLSSTSGGEMSPESVEELQRMTAKAGVQGDVGKFYRQAAGGVDQVGGLVKSASSLEAGRIGAGSQFGGLMASMQKATIGSVNALGNFSGALTALSDSVTKFMNAIDKMLQGNWIEASIGKR